jgi:hypothetical protein
MLQNLESLNNKSQNPVSDYAAGGRRVTSLRQFSYRLAKANYWPSRKAGNNNVQEEANRIYGRIANKLDSKEDYKNLTFDVLWSAIRSCKLELNSWVSKRDVLNVYLGLPHMVQVYRDENMVIFKKSGGENNDS